MVIGRQHLFWVRWGFGSKGLELNDITLNCGLNSTCWWDSWVRNHCVLIAGNFILIVHLLIFVLQMISLTGVIITNSCNHSVDIHKCMQCGCIVKILGRYYPPSPKLCVPDMASKVLYYLATACTSHEIKSGTCIYNYFWQ